MRGEWNRSQALLLNDCPYAYYVHCFAYRLQLDLVVASREVIQVHEFFTQLTSIVNIVGACCNDMINYKQLKQMKLQIGLHLVNLK